MAMAAAAMQAAAYIHELSRPSDWTMVTGMPHDDSTLCDDEPMMARLVSDTSSLLPMITLCTHPVSLRRQF